MDQPDQIDPTVLLEGLAGTYLRNPRRDSGTCSICCAPANPGYETCYDCGFTWRGRLPDLVGFCIYGAQGTQAGQLLHVYKASPPAREHLVVMSLLVQRALVNHAHCPEALVGRRVTHWAVVPSTRGRGSSHPLRSMVASCCQQPEATLVHDPRLQPIRKQVVPGLFRAPEALGRGRHVLLVDDTWVSGGRALSAVLALREVGAERVSVLAIARWLSFDFMRRPSGAITQLHRELLKQDVYDLTVCPYTGGSCPTG